MQGGHAELAYSLGNVAAVMNPGKYPFRRACMQMEVSFKALLPG